jgi:CRP/FNR family cyclic AMP-dependent transcriptional regulator
MEELVLEQFPLFADLTQEDREILAEGFRERAYRRGDIIVDEDADETTLFLIKEGRVRVSIVGDEEREVVLSYLEPADFFGEMSVLDGEPRSARVTAQEDTIALVGTREQFLDRLVSHPQIALNLLKILSQRLRAADEQIESLSFLDVQGRVARHLVELARSEGRQAEAGTIVPMEMTRQELANVVSTSRETLTRVLKSFERIKLIRLMRNEVLIIDEPRLRKKTL